MSFAIDVNVLLYASDEDSPFRPRAVEFLDRCLAGDELLCFAWPTIMNYLRMSTDGTIFRLPLSPATAMSNIEQLLQQPHIRTLAEEEGFWETYRDVAGDTTPRGKLVPDVHLAALLRHHGVRILYTNDKGFRRFDFLQVRNPFE